jgi:ankyrin repeat protein
VPSEHQAEALKRNLAVNFQHHNNNRLTPAEAKAKLRRMGIKYGLLPLMEYAANGNKEVVRLFLISGFDPHTVSANNATVLMAAANFPEIIEMLLAAGANVSLKTDEGNTALMFAVVEKNVESVNLLLQAGAAINERNESGETALFGAVRQDEKEIVKLLLAHGADKNIENAKGQTVLDIANELGRNAIGKLIALHW